MSSSYKVQTKPIDSVIPDESATAGSPPISRHEDPKTKIGHYRESPFLGRNQPVHGHNNHRDVSAGFDSIQIRPALRFKNVLPSRNCQEYTWQPRTR